MLAHDQLGGKIGVAALAQLVAVPYREIWAVDFEFITDPGENPDPVCVVARELRSGRTLRLWRDELGPTPPYPTGADTLFVAYYASAELGCHLALGWPIPERILDLFTEFRNATNGLRPPSGSGLIGALIYYGLDAMGADERRKCVLSSFAAAHGRLPSVAPSSNTVRATLTHWRGCYRPCCRASIFLGRYSVAATWQQLHGSNEPVSRSIQ